MIDSTGPGVNPNLVARKNLDKMYFRYLRALCHRVLGNYEES
jgi:hypothetical protein